MSDELSPTRGRAKLARLQTSRARAHGNTKRRDLLVRPVAAVRQQSATEERQAELDARADAPTEWKQRFDADAPTAEEIEALTFMSAEEEDIELSRIRDERALRGVSQGFRMVLRDFFMRHGYTVSMHRIDERIANGDGVRIRQGERLNHSARIAEMLVHEDEAKAHVLAMLRKAASKGEARNVADLTVALAKLHDVSAKRIPGALQATKFEGKLEHSGGTDNTMNIMLGGMMDIVEERAAEQLPEAIRAELMPERDRQQALTAGPAIEPDEILDAIKAYPERA